MGNEPRFTGEWKCPNCGLLLHQTPVIALCDTEENEARMRSDADKIFKAITSGDFPTLAHARGALATFYSRDPEFSRAGIWRALGMLKVYYSNRDRKAGK